MADGPLSPALASAVRPGNGKALWFRLHGWLAAPIWLILFAVCATGTLATISHELTWLFDPAVRADPWPSTPRLPLAPLVERLERQEGLHVTTIRFGEPYLALELEVSLPDAVEATAWVDPVTGRLQALRNGPSFAEILRALHGWLLGSWRNGTAAGWYVVTVLSLPLLGSLASGIAVYKRFWRAYTRPRLRTDGGSRRLWGDLHRLAGAWSLAFVAVIGLTGLWFLTTGLRWDAGLPLSPARPDLTRAQVPLRQTDTAPPRLDPDALLAAALRLHPGAQPVSLTLPDHAFAPVGVTLRSPWLLTTRELWLDPYDGAALTPAPAGADVALVSQLAASLHFGNFAGLLGKLVWFACGATLSGLVLSGGVVWLKRRGATAWSRRAPVLASLPLLLLPLLTLPAYLGEDALAAAQAKPLAAGRVGPWRVTLAELPAFGPDGAAGKRPKAYELRFPDGYPADRLRAAYLRVGAPNGIDDAGPILAGNPFHLRAQLPAAPPGRPDDRLWLTVETWNGTLHQTSWPLSTIADAATTPTVRSSIP